MKANRREAASICGSLYTSAPGYYTTGVSISNSQLSTPWSFRCLRVDERRYRDRLIHRASKYDLGDSTARRSTHCWVFVHPHLSGSNGN